MSSRASQNVVVMMGGLSSEREVSLSTGRECAQALRDAGFEVTELDAGHDVAERLAELAPDVVFNALHGRWGEDGAVQGILEWLRLPYTHSGLMASATAMDKEAAKAAFRRIGLPVAESRVVARGDVAAAHVMDRPYVVKPVADGSSVGVVLVLENDPTPKIDPEGPDLMVEAYVPGRELTTTVMGDKALGVTEIISPIWYDYEAKYAPGGSTHTLPADVPADVYGACEDFAVRAHAALGCRGISRTDFRWDDSKGLDGLIVLETNTQPGMTPTSLSPEQAAHQGISFPELCAWLVEDASCDR